jgi:hypothetical protein
MADDDDDMEEVELITRGTRKHNASEQFNAKYKGLRLQDVVMEDGKEVVEHRQIIDVVFQKPPVKKAKKMEWMVQTNLLEVKDGVNGGDARLTGKPLPRDDDQYDDQEVEDHRMAFCIDDSLHQKIKASPYNWGYFVRRPGQ